MSRARAWQKACSSGVPARALPAEAGAAGRDSMRWVDALRIVQRELEECAAAISEVAEFLSARLDRLAFEIERLLSLFPDAHDLPVPKPRKRLRRESRTTPALDAEAGAASLRVERRADGSARACVNGRCWIPLAPGLATFLSLIADPTRRAEDGLVGWRTKAELAVLLSKKTGRRVLPKDVAKVAYRLRKAFRDADDNWRLIQTNHAGAVRFALRVGGENRGSGKDLPPFSRPCEGGRT